MGEPMTLKFPGGADNRAREYELPEGAAREIVNLDVTRGGGLRCRDGARRVAVGAFHSPFKSSNFALIVKDGQLCRFDSSASFVALGSVSGRVRYAELDGAVYWTDGAQVGRVSPSGAAGSWGAPTPPQIQAVASATGGLAAGSYQATYTALFGASIETGAPAPAVVEVPEGGGVTVTTPASSSVFRVYMTGADGESRELRHVATLAGGATATLGAGPRGKALKSLLAQQPYSGSDVVAYRARLYVAAGAIVFFTSEMSPHWVFPAEGHFRFDGTVTMLAAADDGVYVATANATYLLSGLSPSDMRRRVVIDCGAVPGSASEIPDDWFSGDGEPSSRRFAWLDTRGRVVIGMPGGVIRYPHAAHYLADSGDSGFTAWRERDGLRQVMALASGAEPAIAATDVSVASVFDYGLVLG